MSNTLNKTLFYSAVALGSIIFAIASTSKAIAAEPTSWEDVKNSKTVIYAPVEWVNMDQVKQRIEKRKAVKEAIAEMENNPHCINMIEENANQMASVR